jgi:DNA-binding transcriptional MerR regulator
MDQFTIKDIEQLTGIKAHTLRVWEQRYSILAPQREGRKHRTYSGNDLKLALRIAQVYHAGLKISAIANMTEEQITQLSLDIRGQSIYEAHIIRLIEATVDFDEPAFLDTMESVINEIGVTRGVSQVIYPFLQRIGVLWMNGRVKPGQEHFASFLIRNRIIRAIDSVERRKTDHAGRISFFGPSGEHHEIPLLFAHYLFKKNGWHTTYLGMDLPIEDIQTFMGRRPNEYLFFHMLTNLTQMTFPEYVTTLSMAVPKAHIIVSGPHAAEFNMMLPNVQLLGSLEDMLELTGNFY